MREQMLDTFRANPYHTSRRKRWLDLGVTIPARIVSYPIEKATALYLRSVLGDGDDTIYRQERSLFGIAPFTMSKLRTMRHSGPSDKEVGYLAQNPRIPSMGALIIRLFRVDELPQLNTVVKGQMCVVSIRPLDEATLEHYRDIGDLDLLAEAQRKAKLNEIKPGLTGLAQIDHLTNDYRDADLINNHLELDIDYMDNATLRGDMKILAGTVVALATDCGAKAFDYIRGHMMKQRSFKSL